MSSIRLYNTMTRAKETFAPLDPANVRLYVCGPTVYDRAHLGNARPVVVFDVLFRLLRHVYGAEHVRYVRNITDIDDKINDRAAEIGRPIAEITAQTLAWYVADMAALGNLEPSAAPRATAHIPQMIAMIEALVAAGHAYPAEGHVLFRVRSFAAYGRLSRRSVDDMIAGARVEVAPYKEDPLDFVLWKPSPAHLPGWKSPWGRGRPGWHIECSAMSLAHLGGSFDIHGGGNDLTFPHHENEIAQSNCAHPDADFARIWMHNEMLQVEGRKMSKSLGNFFTVRDLLDRGVPGEVIRFAFLATHYRKPMDWTERRRERAEATLERWRRLIAHDPGGRLDPAVRRALADDLNVPLALARLHEMARQLERAQPDGAPGLARDFTASCQFLGLMRHDRVPAALTAAEARLVERLLAARAEARARKDWARADALREGFASAGLIVNDTPEGPRWQRGGGFDPAKLEALL